MKYDPSKSEAYKALQEEAHGDTIQEVRQPARTGVFSPQKVNHNKVCIVRLNFDRVYHPPRSIKRRFQVHHARPKSPAGPYVSITV